MSVDNIHAFLMSAGILMIRLEMTPLYIVHRLTERRAGEDREMNETKDRLKNVLLLRFEQ